MGLRERKKLAARAALSWAALKLAMEHGPENVRVEQIAAEAGVSPRTFNNYFSSKEEAICAIGLDRQERVRAALLARPADEPLWDAVIGSVLEQYGGEPDREQVARVRLQMRHPSLLGEHLKARAEIERVLAEGIAERIGTDIRFDMYPSLVAGAVSSATRVAMNHWLNSEPPAELIPIMTEALRSVAAGLPQPPRRKKPSC
ncbi:acyl-CoA-like ligand-binding transcription factor [Allokutzneria albata]|uniref:DNA-binding transcriptional regulator, AcrR family n=1 Tax=Allokutzneria albata TaxID=211114 RepID=A0A1G9RXE1_ALLAB|nr:TetR family transcriptional regulator [Allokutzneria albata]SDM27690.1 DNA-binding transcriptional regulator, AcrR family [Allokutzneria albata]